MTTANKVFAGPVEATKPLMREANIKAGETLVGGHLVNLDGGEWQAHDAADAGGDVCIIDMDTIGQKAIGETLTVGQAHPALIPQVGFSYNVIVAASQTIAKGVSLASNGDGTVKVAATDGTSEALFVADEAITTGAGVTGRITARYNPTGANATT